ncbi:VOC family protein [Bacillus sp. FJAT-28004]|uniref:VOC family protein n=1 Tax=Bacillus sp. FJAT-28004 TaxID=1679165 RepID=UPI0006B49B34|nr:VOC family protein [Bacillus sp. FJAT-28004]
MAFQSANIFVNLPIKDLNKTVDFFSKLGFEFNPQFTDEKATCMIIGPNIFAMLLVEEYFQTFINKEISDPSKTTEVILALSAESREQVDEIVNKALAAGGKPAKDPIDHGFMYSWSFQDIDDHLWELVYMDPSTIEQG